MASRPRQQEELDALSVAQTRRTRAVAAIDTQIKSRDGEITRLQSQARSLERLIAELRKALENVPVAKQAPFEGLRGKLPWPVQSGKVLARFGQPRAGGSLRWQGMLVGTDRGARVRAPFAGRVVYADWLPGMGLMIVLDHGKGYMSLYGHNEELFRKVGEPVGAGDVIASVGDSGGHNQPALYFEVRRGREPVNPENLAAAALIRRRPAASRDYVETRQVGVSPRRRGGGKVRLASRSRRTESATLCPNDVARPRVLDAIRRSGQRRESGFANDHTRSIRPADAHADAARAVDRDLRSHGRTRLGERRAGRAGAAGAAAGRADGGTATGRAQPRANGPDGRRARRVCIPTARRR